MSSTTCLIRKEHEMKLFIATLLTLTATAAHADALSAALRDGRESCGLKYELVNPNDLASKKDFPGVPFAPIPGLSYSVIGEYHYFRKGSIECGQAAAALVKRPNEAVACITTHGYDQPRIPGGIVVGADAKKAAHALVKRCVADVKYVSPCLSEWIVCFNRN